MENYIQNFDVKKSEIKENFQEKVRVLKREHEIGLEKIKEEFLEEKSNYPVIE